MKLKIFKANDSYTTHKGMYLFCLIFLYGWQEDSLTRCKTVQGFITTTGRFVNRKEAWEIARAAGQIDDNGGYNRELFSEDLY